MRARDANGIRFNWNSITKLFSSLDWPGSPETGVSCVQGRESLSLPPPPLPRNREKGIAPRRKYSYSARRIVCLWSAPDRSSDACRNFYPKRRYADRADPGIPVFESSLAQRIFVVFGCSENSWHFWQIITIITVAGCLKSSWHLSTIATRILSCIRWNRNYLFLGIIHSYWNMKMLKLNTTPDWNLFNYRCFVSR